MTERRPAMEPSVERAPRRVLVLGDSWIHGLGSERKRNFGALLCQSLSATEVLDLSAVSRTTRDVVRDHLSSIVQFAPDIAVMNVGGTESLVFPAPPIQRLIDRYAPPRWHGPEGLMPPVRYSREKSRRVRQKLAYIAKLILKQIVINLLGGRRRTPLGEFGDAAMEILELLASLGTSVIVIGVGPVDGRLSPRTNRSIADTNVLLRRLVAAKPNCLFISSQQMPRKWDDYLSDRVHLSRSGHQRVADGVMTQLSRSGAPWTALLGTAEGTVSRQK
jgi:lysophospholipase L1-like esterase